MKNIFVKILLGMVFGLFILWYFTNQSRVKNKEESKQVSTEKDSIKIEYSLLDFKYEAIKKSKNKTDTVIKDISGHTRIVYERKIAEALNKPTELVYLTDPSFYPKMLQDSLTTNVLSLGWIIEYSGTIDTIDFTYSVKQKTVTIEHVTEVPVPFEVVKWEKKKGYYASYYCIANFDDFRNPYHDISFGRYWKSGIGLGGGLLVMDKVYLKVGVDFRF